MEEFDIFETNKLQYLIVKSNQTEHYYIETKKPIKIKFKKIKEKKWVDEIEYEIEYKVEELNFYGVFYHFCKKTLTEKEIKKALLNEEISMLLVKNIFSDMFRGDIDPTVGKNCKHKLKKLIKKFVIRYL